MSDKGPLLRGALAGAVLGALGMWLLGARGPDRLAAVTTHGEWVTFPNATGDSIRAYVAYPERKDPAPAVVVIHEIYGLTGWEPSVADRLAGAGYVAIVPDLLSTRFRATPADPDSGRKLTALLVPEQVTADLNSTFEYINALPAVRKEDIATIGFCWGGGQSFRYATNNPRLRAVVVCYGPAPDSAALSRIEAPVFGVYGENDARIDAALPEVAQTMKALGKKFAYEIFPGTGHGFLKPGREGSDGDQPERAWKKILKFYEGSFGK